MAKKKKSKKTNQVPEPLNTMIDLAGAAAASAFTKRQLKRDYEKGIGEESLLAATAVYSAQAAARGTRGMIGLGGLHGIQKALDEIDAEAPAALSAEAFRAAEAETAESAVTPSGLDDAMKAAGLNQSQRRFCKQPIGKNVRLLAPAGSGKTLSLLWRCRFIAEERKKKNLPPPNFLIVTFTSVARFELENRLNNVPEFQELCATVRTLNAWGWELLKGRTGRELAVKTYDRRNLITHDLLPICKKYESIYSLIKSSKGQAVNAPLLIDTIDDLKSLGFVHTMKKSEFRAHLKYLTGIGLYPLYRAELYKVLQLGKVDLGDKKAAAEAEWEFFSFWKAAVKQLEENNRYTLEDQKYWARVRLEERIAAGKHAPANYAYTHIFVDEFQDINPLDLSLIKAIASYHDQGKHVGITIAGDDDQAIFGWRGTTPSYILNPEQYFEMPFVTCVLDTNYRSPAAIVQASSQLIQYNRNRVEKKMRSAAPGRAYLKTIQRKRSGASMDFTLKLIHELLEEKGCEKVALIARRQASLFPYQVMLSEEGSPFYVDADIDIFEGEAMAALQEILQIIYRAKADDNDDAAGDLLKVCDKVDRYQLQNKEKQEIALYLEQFRLDSFADAVRKLSQYPGDIKKRSPEYFTDAVQMLLNADSVTAFMNAILSAFRGFDRDYMKADQDTHYKNPQFVRLRDLSKKYGDDFRRFYKDLDRARRSVEYSRRQIADETGKGFQQVQETRIHLLTATRSKGKEFDAVIIPDCDDADWPAQLSTDMEEERRLFYVAMTRAKRYLYFVVPGDTCSRFLLEAGVG